MQEFESQRLKAAIKTQLVSKKLKYKDLALHLECSVPTVKRILGEEELSLNRLLKVLKFLDLTLSELEMLAARNEPSQQHKFTPDQEKFLVQNPNCFAYLMRLYAGDTPGQIAVSHKLDARKTDKYLIALERMGLIRVTGSQKVKPVLKGFPSLGNGPLAKAYFQSFIESTGAFFIKVLSERIYAQEKPKDEPGHFRVNSGKASLELYRRYESDQEKLLNDFLKASAYEEKTLPPEKLKTAVIAHAGAFVPSDHRAVSDLDNVFGQIT